MNEKSQTGLKRSLLLGAILIISLLTLVNAFSDVWWDSFRQVGNTTRAQDWNVQATISSNNVSKLIATHTGAYPAKNSPVYYNGYVYYGVGNVYTTTILYQLNASNVSQQVDSYTTGGGGGSSSLTVDSGYLYFAGANSFKIYQLNASHISQVINILSMDEQSYYAPTVANGYLYVSTSSNGAGTYSGILQLNATTLQLLHQYKDGNAGIGSGVVYNGYYYAATEQFFYQLNATNVSQMINKIAMPFGSSSGVSEWNNFIYTSSNANNIGILWQLNATNVSKVIANYSLVSGTTHIYSSPAIANGYLYFYSDNGYLYQLNASDITLVHKVAIGSPRPFEPLQSSPVVANGYVYFGGDGIMRQLNASDVTQKLANYSIAPRLITLSPIVVNGSVYFGDDDLNYGPGIFYQVGGYDAIDVTPPKVNMTYPLNITYTINVSNINYTASDETFLNKCWYSTNGGTTNSTQVNGGTNFTNVVSTEGSNTWTVYCNDAIGNVNSSNVTFFQDSISPFINITLPLNNSIVSNSQAPINYTVSDTNLQSCWWTRNNGVTNTSITCGVNVTGITWNEGVNNVTIWANDTLGNINSSSVLFYLDTITPALQIIYPTNSTYLLIPTSLNYTVSDTNLQSCWYSTNGGTTNTSITCGVNVSGLTAPQGSSTWKIWANDSVGHVNSTSVTFFVDSIPPVINLMYPTNNSWLNSSVIFNFTATSTNGIDTCELWGDWGHTNYIDGNAATGRGSFASSPTGPTTGTLAWKTYLEPNMYDSYAGASIVDGYAYLVSKSSTGGQFWKIDIKTGAKICNLTVGESDTAPVYYNGVVYLGSMLYNWPTLSTTKAKFYAINSSDCSIIWNSTNTTLGFIGTATINPVDNIVYGLNIAPSMVIAYNMSNGNQLWNYTNATNTAVAYGIATYSNGVLYYAHSIAFSTTNNWLYAINATNGSLIWKTNNNPQTHYRGIWDTFPVIDNGQLYIGRYGYISGDAIVQDYNITNGNLLKTFNTTYSATTGSEVLDGVAIHNNVMWYQDNKGNVKAYYINTTLPATKCTTTLNTGAGEFSSPVIANGVVYIGSGTTGQSITALNETNCNTIFTYAAGDRIFSQPAVADGLLFFISDDGYIYALGNYSTFHKNQTVTSVTSGALTSFSSVSLTTGKYNWNVWCNDTNGNGAFNSTNFLLNMDLISPNVTLISPTNGTYYNISQNFTANLTDNMAIKNATLYIYNSTTLVKNQTVYFTEGITQSVVGFVVNLADGIYKWFYSLFDYGGNSYTSNNNTVTIDTIAPTINIIYPTAIAYGGAVTQLNYTASDTNLKDCWYNDGLLTSTSCNNFTGLNLNYGTNTWKVYARDLAGNVNSSSVTFTYNPSSLNVTGCQTLNMSNIWYVLNQSIVNNSLSDNGCLYVIGDNVTIDCEGNSITSSSNSWAINSEKKNTVIKNCVIDMTGYGSAAIRINDSVGHSMANVTTYSGNGISSTAIPISTPEQFLAIGTNLTTMSGDYILTNDIDMTGYPVNNAIGYPLDFQGHLNGHGHKITNLIITSTTSYAALFSELGGIIENIDIDGNYTTNADDASGIADSIIWTANVFNTIVRANLTGGASGGICVGNIDVSETIQNSLFLGTATGIHWIFGIGESAGSINSYYDINKSTNTSYDASDGRTTIQLQNYPSSLYNSYLPIIWSFSNGSYPELIKRVYSQDTNPVHTISLAPINNGRINTISSVLSTDNENATIRYDGVGNYSTKIQMVNTNVDYNITYDGVPCGNSNCSVNSKSNGLIDINFTLGSQHILQINQYIIPPVVIIDNGGGAPSTGLTNISNATDRFPTMNFGNQTNTKSPVVEKIKHWPSWWWLLLLLILYLIYRYLKDKKDKGGVQWPKRY